MTPSESRAQVAVQSVALGMLAVMTGTIPRNLLFLANLRFLQAFPWAAPVAGIYIWFFWSYLKGNGAPASTSSFRRASLRANPVSRTQWVWSLAAGGSAIVALVVALRLVNRFVVLPVQQLPDLSGIPAFTVWTLLLAAAPIAGIIEESAFRGYMQGPIEKRYGLPVAILITGTMFAVAHLDFTLILWPYYVAVAAIYGTVTYLTDSIFPAIVLHTCGNTYSNLDLLLHKQAEWQASSQTRRMIWQTGLDRDFWVSFGWLVLAMGCSGWSYFILARSVRKCKSTKEPLRSDG